MCSSNDYLVLLFTKMCKMCKILLSIPSSGDSLETKYFDPIFVEQNCDYNQNYNQETKFLFQNQILFYRTKFCFMAFFFMLVDVR